MIYTKLKILVIILFYITLIVLLTSFKSLFSLTLLIQHHVMQKYEVENQERLNSARPKLIWLMSFPNSGNSFTTQMIRILTNESTATNYGEEHVNSFGFSETIEDGIEYKNGPFLVLTSNKRKLPNGKFILTKVSSFHL